MLQFYDGLGNKITLGQQIGAGREGTIYEIAGDAGRVAKIYKPDVELAEKNAKLEAMARVALPDLLAITAWPQGKLYDAPAGSTCGFLMRKAPGYEIHELYNPSHRRRKFPEANWKFLIQVACQLASAVHVVHAHGHVIGDLNQRGVFTHPENGAVTLIDCDSFQISFEGKVHLCGVGFKEFSPPELQGQPLAGRERTRNHDHFALAVLLFQLLFMGRHPFAGLYQGKEEDSLEQAIREFRFAYGRPAHDRLTAPPHTLSLTELPSQIANLFEIAFAEAAAREGNRPAALAWKNALEALLAKLRVCAANASHQYYAALGACPWCKIERATGSQLFGASTESQSEAKIFNLEETWRKICAVLPPEPAKLPLSSSPDTETVNARPLPPELHAARKRKRVQMSAAFVVSGALLFGVPHFGLLAVLAIVGVLGWAFTREVNDEGEGENRRQALQRAEMHYQSLRRRWQEEAHGEAFWQKLRELENVRAEFMSLPEAYEREYVRLEAELCNAQREAFLAQRLIRYAPRQEFDAELKDLAITRGIRTAADITPEALQRITAFGPARTLKLLKWRESVVARFAFDPEQGMSAADLKALEQKYAARMKVLQTALSLGPQELQRASLYILRQREKLARELERAALQLAQAKADVAVM